MNVIVFASRKGGSGKSTLAAHLAAQIKATKPILLVDDRTDTGWTLTLVTRLLREAGAGPVYPFVLAVDA